MRPRFWLASLILAAVTAAACGGETTSKDEYMARAKSYVEEDKYAEAIVELRNAIAIDPMDGEARYQLAELYSRTNDGGKAAGEYIRASDLSPDNLDAHMKAAQFLLLGGRFEDAKTRADMVISQEPTDVNAHLVKGLALAGLKDLNSAIDQTNDALALDETNVTSHVLLGRIQAQQGKISEAEETLKRAIELAPDAPEAPMALANFYLATGRREEA